MVEKILERLEAERKIFLDEGGLISASCLQRVKEIVQEVAKEYNDEYEKGFEDGAESVRALAPYEIITNADRIRNMTDEELAEFLRETVWEEGANLFDCADYTCGCPCAECPTYLQWLKSEAKE